MTTRTLIGTCALALMTLGAASVGALAPGRPPAGGPAHPAPAADTVPPRAGDVLKPDSYHRITNTGVYGLGAQRPGNSYALSSGLLVRIDSETGKVLSILRMQRDILD